MASFSQISAALKQLTPEAEEFVEKDNKWVIKVNGKEYTVEKPKPTSITSTIYHHFISGLDLANTTKRMINDLKKFNNVTTSFAGEFKFLEPAYHPHSDECIITAVARMVPTDNEKYFHNLEFHSKLMDELDD